MSAGKRPTSWAGRARCGARDVADPQAPNLPCAPQTSSKAEGEGEPREVISNQVPTLQQDILVGVLQDISNDRIHAESISCVHKLYMSRIKEDPGVCSSEKLSWFKKFILGLQFKAHADGRFSNMPLEPIPPAEGQPCGLKPGSSQSSTSDTGASSSGGSVSDGSDTVEPGVDARNAPHQPSEAPEVANGTNDQALSSASSPVASPSPSPSPQQASSSSSPSSPCPWLELPPEQNSQHLSRGMSPIQASPGDEGLGSQVASAAEGERATERPIPTDEENRQINIGTSRAQGDICSPLEAMASEQLVTYLQSIDTRMRFREEQLEECVKGIFSEIITEMLAKGATGTRGTASSVQHVKENILRQAPQVAAKLAAKNANGRQNLEGFGSAVRDMLSAVVDGILQGRDTDERARVMEELTTTAANKWAQQLLLLGEEDQRLRRKNQTCGTCGQSEIILQRQAYSCSAKPCKRKDGTCGATFYASPSNQLHFCTSCYGKLPDDKSICNTETALRKANLLWRTSDASPKEHWVQCGTCEIWVHHACGLFNKLLNGDFECPRCILKDRAAETSAPRVLSPNPCGAKALPSSRLAQDMLVWTERELAEVYAQKAVETNVSIEEVPKVAGLTVREVSSVDMTQTLKPEFLARYGNNDGAYPKTFQYRSRCLVLFQEVNGLDVMLFGLIVYEYGDTCHAANKGRVYISYLDSVSHMVPHTYRTHAYRGMLVGYLDHVRKLGFHTAQLWVCPPAKGEDFIFLVHPEDQKALNLIRLTNWYGRIFGKAKDLGVVESVTNMFEEFFSKSELDARVVPLIEGDWVTEVFEEVIKAKAREYGDIVPWPLNCPTGEAALHPEVTDAVERIDTAQLTARPETVGSVGAGASAAPAAVPSEATSRTAPNGGVGASPSSQLATAAASTGLAPLRGMTTRRSGRAPKGGSEAGDTAVPPAPVIKRRATTDPGQTRGKRSRPHRSKDDPVMVEMAKRVENNKGVLLVVKLQCEDPAPPMQGGNSDEGTEAAVSNPNDTIAKREIKSSQILRTRTNFLAACRGNNYQFDTVRRATFATMMANFHLRHPGAPISLPLCRVCEMEVYPGDGVACEECHEFNMHEACHRTKPHDHPVTEARTATYLQEWLSGGDGAAGASESARDEKGATADEGKMPSKPSSEQDRSRR